MCQARIDHAPLLRVTLILAAILVLLAKVSLAEEPARRKHQSPAAKGGGEVVGLCDGTTSVAVPGLAAGRPLENAQARQVADELMSEWRRKNPGATWDEPVLLAQNAPAPKGSTTTSPRSPPQATTTAPPGTGQGASTGGTTGAGGGHTYGAFSERDRLVWQASVDQVVEDGNRIFHDAKRLGGTTGISCDMCHPNAANTHPETYPKFQVQLGRVALLRDMINWCVENPVRGKPLADDSDDMRALEAFIYASRKGVPLEYGKH